MTPSSTWLLLKLWQQVSSTNQLIVRLAHSMSKIILSYCFFVGKKEEALLHEVARHYKNGMNDMDGRAPGSATIKGKNIAWIAIRINT